VLDEGWLSLSLRLLAIGCLGAHFWQLSSYPEVMNLRTTIAVCSFILMAFFAGRLTTNRYAIPLLQLFGLAGAILIMSILHTSAA